MQINSAKLIVEILDETTGEIITREATLGDFKEVKKSTSTSTRTKKSKDTDPNPKITLLEGKIQMNNACVELVGWEPEMKIDVKFEKKGRVTTPVLCEDEKSGNRLTKTFTISCGSYLPKALCAPFSLNITTFGRQITQSETL